MGFMRNITNINL